MTCPGRATGLSETNGRQLVPPNSPIMADTLYLPVHQLVGKGIGTLAQTWYPFPTQVVPNWSTNWLLHHFGAVLHLSETGSTFCDLAAAVSGVQPCSAQPSTLNGQT